MFNNANNTFISGGSFTVQWRQNSVWEQGFRAPGAFHDSEDRYDPPKCHPRTRAAIIKKTMGCVKDDRKVTLFLWLRGPAGAGKSAILRTISAMSKREKRAQAHNRIR
ncbi:hypothetical protein BDZ97DRAFT_1829847 [Flammula alnicola]|nr:hypothetical protein BDZ97DRAFT_1829847 [Flammula alnicola]